MGTSLRESACLARVCDIMVLAMGRVACRVCASNPGFCTRCKGTGICSRCNGSAVEPGKTPEYDGDRRSECRECRGAHFIGGRCRTCQGDGKCKVCYGSGMVRDD